MRRLEKKRPGVKAENGPRVAETDGLGTKAMPHSEFEQTVLETIEHSPVGAVPRIPTYLDALAPLLASFQVYAAADQKDVDPGCLLEDRRETIDRPFGRRHGVPAVDASRQAEQPARMRHAGETETAIAIGIDRRTARIVGGAQDDAGSCHQFTL